MKWMIVHDMTNRPIPYVTYKFRNRISLTRYHEGYDKFLFASILWVGYSIIPKNWSSWIHALFDYNHDTKIIMVIKLRVKEDSNHILSDKLILKISKCYYREKQWEQTPTITHLLCASNDIWTFIKTKIR